MNLISIQINHEGILTKQQLANFLNDEIGEEYNLSEEEVADFFSLESCLFLPNQTFITVFTISFPDLELRDVEPQDIVLSYLKSLSSHSQVISVVKTYDAFLHNFALKYYEEIIALEMQLRNVLTYILCYDDKTIEEQLFKDFGINKSEKIEFDKAHEKYENGLFYIYFNHYAHFSEPQKIKADQIIDLLQNPTIQSFEDFKHKIKSRAIQEDRHTQFLLSIKTKLKPLEEMRNAIMHIRNLSSTVISNYDKAVKDFGEDKGVKTLLENFWQSERQMLNKTTWLALAKEQIKKLITITENEEGQPFYRMNDDYYEYEFMEGYSELDEFKDDLLSYLISRIELPGFDHETVEFETTINELIDSLLKKESRP